MCRLILVFSLPLQAEEAVRIGSKSFTEGIILGEILKDTIEQSGTPAVHKRSLGGTRILWQALIHDEIDAYPEYLGTITQEILKNDPDAKKGVPLGKILGKYGVAMSRSLGFQNAYAIGMRADKAQALGIRKISDLGAHQNLKMVFSDGFMGREDGWPRLKIAYDLGNPHVRVIEHAFAYQGLLAGAFDVTDVYTTDAELVRYPVRILEDDRHFFPRYDAVILYRKSLQASHPSFVNALGALEGRLSNKTMSQLNAKVLLEKKTEAEVASAFTGQQSGGGPWGEFLRQTGEHLYLVALSMILGIVTALPLGVLAARRRRLGAVLLGAVGVLQTIPSLALLVFMIPLFGIGTVPAVAALYLYSLFPMVRNTCTGLQDIPISLIESAEVIGLSSVTRLWRIELPLASRSILSGIKTAFVINVGTATLGALIGAGGYGEAILSGIRLGDVSMTLRGAVPAALLALCAQGIFLLIDDVVIPKGLRVT